MSERTLPPYEISNDPKWYIPFLDQKLAAELNARKEKDREKFLREFEKLYHAVAYHMVRYAAEDDTDSYSPENNVEIINPQTDSRFTLPELGFEKQELMGRGSNAGSFFEAEPERLRYIPLVALALYWAVNKSDVV